MRRAFVVAVVVGLGWVAEASAQSAFVPNRPNISPYSQGTLSPYLNLLRGGPANYQLGVLPEFNLRATSVLADYNYQINLLQSGAVGRGESNNLFLDDDQLSPTGHPAAFMYYNGHYQVPNVRSFVPYNSAAPGQSPRGPVRR